MSNRCSVLYLIRGVGGQVAAYRLLTAKARVHVRFVVDKVVLGNVFLPVLMFSVVSVIPPLLHIHSCVICGMDNESAQRLISIET